MRNTHNSQPYLGDIAIADIEIDLNSRDDIPAILFGLKRIYCNLDTRKEILQTLQDNIAPDVSRAKGRPGMSFWNIVVPGVLKANLNTDYDRIQELANNHITIRQMLGHGSDFDADYRYGLQTIKDNIDLLTPEITEKINAVVVNDGHKFVGHGADETLRGRADSFVVETNVDFPTDLKLLQDAFRKAILAIFFLCTLYEVPGWRKHEQILKKLKKFARKASQLKRSAAKDEEKRAKREQLIQDTYRQCIEYASKYIKKMDGSLQGFPVRSPANLPLFAEIYMYLNYAKMMVCQIDRRVLKGEKIPHNEKIFSVFEEYTEWISKGKAGVPVELGLKVCILEDQYGFILNHRVMQDETDDQIAVPLIKSCQKTFPLLRTCSFDRGFHSPKNQKELATLLDLVVLPKKGRRNKAEQERESSVEFIAARHQHSAVESAINALEVHGLGRCRNRGRERFYSYVALGVLARNIQILGTKVRNTERQEKREAEKALRKAA